MGVDSKSRKMLARLLGVFLFLFVGLFSFSLGEANDFESALKDLGNKSRSKIKLAVKRLGNMGNPKALPALEALKNKRLKINENGTPRALPALPLDCLKTLPKQRKINGLL